MPLILSISHYNDQLWAAGPDGLFRVVNGELVPVAQPQEELVCCAVTDSHVLVGGSPHGTAFTTDAGAFWQAAWMDGVVGPVLCMAVDPRVAESGAVLAGSAEGGILRTHNRGRSWTVCNFGLQDYTVLSLAWAPPAPATAWPRWDVVFAGTETGLYRSPNGGLGWRRVEGLDIVAQTVAVAPDFHRSGVVLAGTETSGLWRSVDGGVTFASVLGTPDRIDALTAAADGWFLSDDKQLWRSDDGARWQPIDDSRAALFLLATPSGIWAGGEQGVIQVT